MRLKLEVGSEVRIVSANGGMPIFIGCTGHVYNVEMDGRTKMYRVMLDRPVNVPGIGEVKDDLWSREHLKVIG